MANLQLNRRWERFEPTLDGNDKLDRPFYFELACGLTRAELRKLDSDVSRLLRERITAATSALAKPVPAELATDDERREALNEYAEGLADVALKAEVDVFAELFEPFVRMGSEPLTVAGQPVSSLRQYLEAVAAVADQYALMEVSRALHRYNSLEGAQVVFSKRPSGGRSGTADRSNGSAGHQTAAH